MNQKQSVTTQNWFLYSNSSVSGPFTTELVQEKIKQSDSTGESYIWWKGQREWIPVSVWKAQLDDIIKIERERVENPVWYLDLGHRPTGPITEGELIQQLSSLSDLSSARIWTNGMKSWSTVFELNDLMEKLGISRRENRRAPLIGSVALTASNRESKGLVARATSISAAGIGIAGHPGIHDLFVGQKVSISIKSPGIGVDIYLHGEVAYVSKSKKSLTYSIDSDPTGNTESYAGVRFDRVHPETLSLILDYIRMFHEDQTESKAA